MPTGVIELPEGFRDLLIELSRATSWWSVVTQSRFTVMLTGVLQIGVPPFRIDVLNSGEERHVRRSRG